MSRFRQIRDAARSDVHQRLAVPAFYITQKGATPASCRVRVWDGFDQIGQPVSNPKDFVTRTESTPRIRFLASDLPVRAANAVVLLNETLGYRVDHFEPVDGGYVTAHVVSLDPKIAAQRWPETNGDATQWQESGFVQVRRNARDDLHAELNVDAYCLLPKSDSPASVTVRVWSKDGMIGSNASKSEESVTRYEAKDKLRFKVSELPLLVRNSVVCVSETEGYRIDRFYSVDDQYVTADVLVLSAEDAAYEYDNIMQLIAGDQLILARDLSIVTDRAGYDILWRQRT